MPPRFHLPADARIGEERMRDGARIRTLAWPHPAPRARLLVLNGRADFLEKWADAYAVLHALGCSVAAFDWRGQGASTRLVNSGAGHIDRFDTWLDDLDGLARGATDLPGDAPLFVVGHSMGGHLALRWAADPARAGHPLRAAMKGLLLLSPFFGLGLSPPMRLAALRTARAQVARGRGEAFAWGQMPYGPLHQQPARQKILTASRAHFEDEALWVGHRPDLATGGVTWGWIAAFADSEVALESLPLERFDRPVLMLLAGEERLVDNRMAQRIADRLPAIERHVIPAAAHELLREADPARRRVLAHVAAFLDRAA